MALKQRLASLFGWSKPTPPVDKKDKDANLGNMGGMDSLLAEYQKSLVVPADRRELYKIYDDLDQDEVAAVLDMYAGDSTQTNRELGTVVWVDAKDTKVKKVVENLFNRLRIPFHSESITRSTGKYGDQYFHLRIEPLPPDDKLVGPVDGEKKFKRIGGWVSRDPENVARIENREGVLIGFDQVPRDKDHKKATVDIPPWDMVHFRLYKNRYTMSPGGQRMLNVYGTSILYPAIKAIRRLRILDDLLMMHRILRSLDRYIYYVDVGHTTRPQEVNILQSWKKSMKKKEWIDPASGGMKNKFDPMSFLEDIFWPVREGSNSRVETLPGISNVSDIVDVDHFVNKVFGSLRAPKGFFGHEDMGGQLIPKNTLAQQDIAFGRTANSLQKAYINGLVRLSQIELAYRNLNADPKTFTIKMVTPSAAEEMERIENLRERVDVTMSLLGIPRDLEAMDPVAWGAYVLGKTLDLTTDEIKLFLGQSTPQVEDEYEPSISLDEVDIAVKRALDIRNKVVD